MRRWLCVFILCIACLGLCLQASALTQINSQSSFATVSADGSCQVTVTATIHLDQPTDGLVFPVPRDAASISLNGSWVRIQTQSEAKLVPLSGKVAGDISFTVSYTLPNLVSTNEAGLLELRLPLLSGFAHPISFLEFSVTMPGPTNTQPAFSSGYHQATIEEDLSFVVDGAMISGRSQKALKDHETLVMILPVSEEMFPQAVSLAPNLEVTNIAAIVCAVLTVLFWLLFLRTLPPRIPEQSIPPEGYSAGQLPCLLFLQGADLSMMIFTWAQLGYLVITVDDNGRVFLHKRMEMGNERSAYENKYFKELFGRRRIVDGTSYRYAELCRRLGKKSPRLKDIYLASSGNPYLYRGLCALGGVFSGVAIAGGFNPYSGVLSVLLGALAGVLALLIQNGGRYMPLRQQAPVKLALVGGALWLVLGIWSGQWLMALVQIVFQLLAGLALAYGGKRTDLGQQAQNQISGLRKHMRTVSKQELQRLLKSNPNYFYELAPYALALGLDKTFARRFARLRMPECTYLLQPGRGQLTATEWAALLRTTVNRLDARSKRLFWERLTGRR